MKDYKKDYKENKRHLKNELKKERDNYKIIKKNYHISKKKNKQLYLNILHNNKNKAILKFPQRSILEEV